jgi:hypothetical protein
LLFVEKEIDEACVNRGRCLGILFERRARGIEMWRMSFEICIALDVVDFVDFVGF